MADSEDTTQGSSSSSTPRRRRATVTRRKTTGTATRRTGAKKPGGTRKASGGPGRSSAAGRRTRKQPPSLSVLLGALQKRATEAGSRIAALSGESAEAARRAVGTLTESSRKTLAGVRREWNQMDTPAKTRFVAALLGTLAAASGSMVASRRRRK